MNIAGSRRPTSALTVDYADVLAQAVENERWRVIREVERIAMQIEIHRAGHREYDPKLVPAQIFRSQLLSRMDQIGPSA